MIEAIDTLTLPDGRVVALFDQVRRNNAGTARHIVQLRGAINTCRSAVVSVVRWIDEMRAKTANPEN